MIKFTQKGSFKNIEGFLKTDPVDIVETILRDYAEQGVAILSNATPKDTGKTAASWYYIIERSKKKISITWCNSNVKEGVCIAVLLQYGHATPSGYYVEGIDYINPAMKPIFESMSESIMREVVKR